MLRFGFQLYQSRWQLCAGTVFKVRAKQVSVVQRDLITADICKNVRYSLLSYQAVLGYKMPAGLIPSVYSA